MNKKNANFFIALVCLLFACGQPARVNDCNKVKYGTFYYYPPKTSDEYVIIRDKDLQKEIINSKDTSFGLVKWKSDCEFSLKFIRNSVPMSDEDKAFNNAHVIVAQIAKVSEQYYIYNAWLDSMESGNPLSDTIWFQPRVKP